MIISIYVCMYVLGLCTLLLSTMRVTCESIYIYIHPILFQCGTTISNRTYRIYSPFHNPSNIFSSRPIPHNVLPGVYDPSNIISPHPIPHNILPGVYVPGMYRMRTIVKLQSAVPHPLKRVVLSRANHITHGALTLTQSHLAQWHTTPYPTCVMWVRCVCTWKSRTKCRGTP